LADRCPALPPKHPANEIRGRELLSTKGTKGRGNILYFFVNFVDELVGALPG
jgi:hypothetical protein